MPETALREMIHHIGLHDRGSTVSLSVTAGTATLRFEIIKPSFTGAAEVTDGAWRCCATPCWPCAAASANCCGWICAIPSRKMFARIK